MTDVNDLLSQIPMDQLARQLGVDEQTAEAATRQALPALLGGMQANAQDPAGAASLSRAVGDHDASLLDGGIDLGQVDVVDGDHIVSNVFGGNRDQVVDRLAGGGADSGLIGKLLPMLAPLVMAYLAKQLQGGGEGPGAAGGPGAGGLGDLLGGLLGGGGQAGGLGDLLGGLLGGGKR